MPKNTKKLHWNHYLFAKKLMINLKQTLKIQELTKTSRENSEKKPNNFYKEFFFSIFL